MYGVIVALIVGWISVARIFPCSWVDSVGGAVVGSDTAETIDGVYVLIDPTVGVALVGARSG